MSIFDEYHDEQERLRKLEEHYNPYGCLDFVQTDIPNVWVAPLPKPEPIEIDEIEAAVQGRIYSCRETLAQIRNDRNSWVLHYLFVNRNIVLASQSLGFQPEKFVEQRWTRKFIDGSPVFDCTNTLRDGPKKVELFRPYRIELDYERPILVEHGYKIHCGDLSPLACALLRTLVEHRVDGDDIIKGLLNESNLEPFADQIKELKLTSLYQGGWKIKNKVNGASLTTAEFVEWIDQFVKFDSLKG